jgi:endonuclease-3
MLKANIHEMFARFAAQDPEPVGELNYKNSYTLLVAVALSAQATDVGVNKATGSLFEVVDTPEKMVALGEDKLRDYIKTIGLFNTKAKNVYKMAQILVDEYGGEVPEDADTLVKLPGVGKKTAAVVLNIAFGHPRIAVDTHIYRLSHRTGLSHAKTADAMMKRLEKIVPAEFLQHAHHWLILHGRYICKARKPDCHKCIIYDLCNFKKKTADDPKLWPSL